MMEDSEANKQVEQFDINVGISIEPAEAVEALLLAQKQARSSAVIPAVTNPGRGNIPVVADSQNIALLANKIVQHAYNFLSGFTTPDGKVPMKAFDEWWNKFKSRIHANPNYLDTLD